MEDEIELKYVAVRNKNKHIVTTSKYIETVGDFTMGFLEAMDFLQYIVCYFSISVAHELWPPRSEYDKNKAFELLEGGRKLLKYNYIWSKYISMVNCRNKIDGKSCDTKIKYTIGPYKFYESLDDGNKMLLYRWYKQSVNKGN